MKLGGYERRRRSQTRSLTGSKTSGWVVSRAAWMVRVRNWEGRLSSLAPLEVRKVTSIESTCILALGQIGSNTSVRKGCFAASGATGFSLVVVEKLSLFVVAGLASH